MIIIQNHKSKPESILKKYPDATLIDVTSKSESEYVKLSPFYPHRLIPVPFSGGWKAACVEAVWQGLKVFEHEDVNTALFSNDTMKNIKRTVKKHGRTLGHRKGVAGKELLDYVEARKQIYIPTYQWMLEHRAMSLVEKLREEAKDKTVVLLDYNTNCDVDDPSSPLSHAFLIKAYIEGIYPFDATSADSEAKSE